jgi:branched-chain amino acid transport system substrate-binding protein
MSHPIKKLVGTMVAAASLFALLGATAPASAQSNEIVIGVNLSLSGPGANLGTPERNALDLVPKEIGGIPVKLIVLDDASDRRNAATNARQLALASKADVLLGSSTTPTTLAVALVANEHKVPQIGLAAMSISPARQKWSIVTSQSTPVMSQALYQHMVANNVKRVGFLGFSEPFGDLWFNDLDASSEATGLHIVDDQRFARGAASVTEQAQQLIAAKTDAILVAASARESAMSQTALRKNGYKGLIYYVQGAASQEFLKTAGPAAEGALVVTAPVIAAETLPDDSPVKKNALAFNQAYEAKHGPSSRNVFASSVFDAFEILKRVVPPALKAAKPGTPEFREAIRQALLSERDIVGASGVYNFTDADRYGQDARARVLLTVKNGAFVIQK